MVVENELVREVRKVKVNLCDLQRLDCHLVKFVLHTRAYNVVIALASV